MVGSQLPLRVHVVHANVTKTIQLDSQIPIYQVCDRIRQLIRETDTPNSAKDYGLFLPHEDPKKGLWLDNGKTLEHYMLHSGDTVEYRFRYRWLNIRTMDDTKKKLQVDDSKTVADLMILVCTKLCIYNYEEYSLIRELDDTEREKTMTLRKSQSLARDQEKLDKLKKKLHTDDDLHWLNPSQTLRQQGIDESEILLFRRKYFFSDMNVDARDPVQLNLLYVQLKDAILNGAHPVTLDEAIQLAGIQCQIQMGNYSAEKFRPGFIELREYLPKEYLKAKTIEKKVANAHGKLQGLSEIEAKVKYCQLCRSLKTYGITFFLVKEKIKGKNKLSARLLGITKDSVVRVDEKSKEILKTWPLTSIHKWAASSNAFTMDFGEYAPDEYYTAQTTEGEQISQLIAGYIDIILKKQKAKDHLGIDRDEESAMYEDNVAPARATIIQHQRAPGPQEVQEVNIAVPGVIRSSTGGLEEQIISDTVDGEFVSPTIYNTTLNSYSVRDGSPDRFMAGGTQTYHIQELSPAQRALVSSIHENIYTIESAKQNLNSGVNMPELGDDEASRRWLAENSGASRQKVSDEIGAMSAAVAQVIRSSNSYGNSGDDQDLMMMQQSFRVITVHFPSFVDDLKKVAYYQTVSGVSDEEKNDDDLLDAARRLAEAFTDLLKSAQPQEGIEHASARKSILEASSRVGEASTDLLHYVQLQEAAFEAADGSSLSQQHYQDERIYQDTLLSLAKAVANATAALVGEAKVVAQSTEDQSLKQNVISAATDSGLATSQLVTCTKVLAPTIQQRACQDQLIEACRDVAKATEYVVYSCQAAAAEDDELIHEIDQSAAKVRDALEELLKHIQEAAHHRDGGPDMTVENFMSAYENIREETDGNRMVAAARKLAQATAQMIASIKSQAETYTDPEQQSRLLAAAKQLADATARLVDAAKSCSSNPNDPEYQVILKQAAEHLTVITYSSDADTIKSRIIHSLQYAARVAVSAATHLVNTSQNSAKKSRASTFQICTDGKLVADLIPKVVMAIRETRRDQDDPLAQLELISACQEFVEPCEQLVHSSQAMCPTVADQALQQALDSSLTQLGVAVEELRLCLSRCEPLCQYLDLAGALLWLLKLIQQVETVERAAKAGHLFPLPDEKTELSMHRLSSSVNDCSTYSQQIVLAIQRDNPEDLGRNAHNLAAAASLLLQATRGVAAGIQANQHNATTQTMQLKMIADCQLALEHCHLLVKEAKRIQTEGTNEENAKYLEDIQVRLQEALQRCLNGLPGHRDLEQALQIVRERRHQLKDGSLGFHNSHLHNGGASQHEAQSNFTASAVELNMATSELSGCHSPPTFARSSNRFASAYTGVISNALQLDGESNSGGGRDQQAILNGLIDVSDCSEHMLVSAKGVCAEPDALNNRQNFQHAVRNVTTSINQLITICSSSIKPGQRECDAAIRQIESVRPLLENPVHPINDEKYFQCLDNITHQTKNLADSLRGMSQGSKEQDVVVFSTNVKDFADSVCHLIEEAAHAAYLVGIADPRSQPGRAALIDHATFQKAYYEIKKSSEAICNPETSEREDHNLIVTSSSSIAKSAKSLCETCRSIAGWAANTAAKRHLQQSGKDILQSTSDLMTATKALDSNFTEENRLAAEHAARTVLQRVTNLIDFVGSHQFAGQPAKISTGAMEAQKPITSSGFIMIDNAINVLLAAQSAMSSNYDDDASSNYAMRSKELSDSIKQLIAAIKDNAPGQRECAEALRRVAKVYRELEDSKIALMNGTTNADLTLTEEIYQKLIGDAARQLQSSIAPMVHTGKVEPENIGRSVLAASEYLSPLISGTIGAASKTELAQNQITYTEHARTVLEALEQLLQAIKTCGGNEKAFHVHEQIDEMGVSLNEALQDMLAALDDIAARQGNMTTMIDTIHKSVTQTQHTIKVNDNAQFSDFQANMVRICHRLNKLTEDMVVRSQDAHTLQDLGIISNSITREFTDLCNECQGGAATITDANKAQRLREGVKHVGQASVALVKSSGDVKINPQTGAINGHAQHDLQEKARHMGERIAELLAILECSSHGTLACIRAASTVSGIIADLDTTIMFASAGTLNPDDHDQTDFSKLRDTIVQTARALVDDTKSLVSGATADQDKLASSANNTVVTISKLTDLVKLGATSLGNEHSQEQILLVNAVKDVCTALQELIFASKDANDAPDSDHAISKLKESARQTVQNVTGLLKTVKTVEDGNQRGTQALDSAIEALKVETASLAQCLNGAKPAGSQPPRLGQTPSASEVAYHTKPLMHAVTVDMAAGTSLKQDDLFNAALTTRHSVIDLIKTTKQQIILIENEEIRKRFAFISKNCSESFIELLQALRDLAHTPTKDGHTRMANAAQRIADCIHDLSKLADLLKEGPRLVLYFRPSSPEWRDVTEKYIGRHVAYHHHYVKSYTNGDEEHHHHHHSRPISRTSNSGGNDELTGTMHQIENAARRLSDMRPKSFSRQASNEIMPSLTKRMLDACSQVAHSTKLLITAASSAKQDLSASGDSDANWTQGLTKTAHLVGAATTGMVDSANALLSGHSASDEHLVAAAQQVASSTAQLLYACRAKPNCPHMDRLQDAGQAVRKATESLVKVVQLENTPNPYPDDVPFEFEKPNRSIVNSMKQIIDTQAIIRSKEREVEQLRQSLHSMRQDQVKQNPQLFD